LIRSVEEGAFEFRNIVHGRDRDA
ncbi:methylglyoxal synthase, partial [Bacillus licheniformis]